MTKNYKVIEIMSKKELIINYGRNNGASEDDKVRIIEVGPEVIDPISKENLGTLDSIKATLSLTTVYDKFSICKEIEEKTSSILAGSLSQFQAKTIIVKPLNVDSEDLSHKKAPNSKIIKIGDIVEIL